MIQVYLRSFIRLFIAFGAVIFFLSGLTANSDKRVNEFRFHVTRGEATLLWSIQGQGRYLGMQDAIAVDDYDGDGAPEILVNTFDGSSARTFFRIVSGKTGQIIRSYSLLHHRTFSGIADFDGNGKKDVVLTSYLAEVSGDPPSSTGGKYLISILNPDLGRIIWKRTSPELEPGFGSSVSVTTDRNGDSIPDLLISSRYNDNHLPRIHFVSGRDGKSFRYFNAPKGSSSFFGSAVVSSKMSHDSRMDLLVSDILFAPTSTRLESRVWAFNGVTNKKMWSQSRSSDTLFGDKAMLTSDMNADQIADFVVSAPNQGRALRGAVSGISGATGKTLWTKSGTIDSGQFGRALEILKDMNGDGISEIAVGGPASLPPMLAGGVPGHFTVLNGKDGNNIVFIEEILPNKRAFSTHFGIRLRSAGDLNNDGREDLLVAAPRFGADQNNGGAPPGLIAAFSLN